MSDDKFSKKMQKNKVKRVLKNAAESYNSEIFKNIQEKMNLNEEEEERIVRLLSNNNEFIRKWVNTNST